MDHSAARSRPDYRCPIRTLAGTAPAPEDGGPREAAP